MVRVEGLGKRFGRRWIFRGLCFELSCGDRLVILGRNGSGKSTLLKAIAGLLTPSEGEVVLPEGDSRLTLGFSALEQSLYPQLTVAEHLQLSADLRGCDSRERELLHGVNLAYAKDVPASQLSTGMKARLRVAMAIQAKPKVLLLDEPGASLDAEGRQIIDRVCEEQADRGVLIVATNDPSERRLANFELELEN